LVYLYSAIKTAAGDKCALTQVFYLLQLMQRMHKGYQDSISAKKQKSNKSTCHFLTETKPPFIF